MAHTRLSLAGVELEEELQRLVVLLAMALLALLFFALALLVLTFLVVFAVDAERRELALGIFGCIYLGLAVLLGWRVNLAVSQRPPLFSATLSELEKDRAALNSRSGAGIVHAPQADEEGA
jgi:uncharacterized membrane protein YqjE